MRASFGGRHRQLFIYALAALTAPLRAQPAITNIIVAPVQGGAIPGGNLQMVIQGNSFGNSDGFNNGDSPCLRIYDVTGNWEAGYQGDLVTVDVLTWTDNQIEITAIP